jgi:hypothetical protein
VTVYFPTIEVARAALEALHGPVDPSHETIAAAAAVKTALDRRRNRPAR